MADAADASFETYFESPRDGSLFAEHGSTVLGGHHHQQFNYLCARFDVTLVRYGLTTVLDSSATVFGLPTISASSPAALYRALLRRHPEVRPEGILIGPSGPVVTRAGALDLPPYGFPEVLHRRVLAGTPASAATLARLLLHPRAKPALLWLNPREKRMALRALPEASSIDTCKSRDDYGSITLRLAHRWKHASRGVVFGDPAAVLSQMAAHCREARVAVYAPREPVPPAAIKVSGYTEAHSPIADATARLARDIGNPVVVGRQTGDADIFRWSREGVCIQIIDPNRPAFPVVETVPHRWAAAAAPDNGASLDDPSDAQLLRWAREGRVLTTLIWHSGEVAHNEAMLALIELAGWADVKMGLGAHASRYESCPQLWELLSIPVTRGGARGRIEPLLHSGGRGVMAECDCPPDLLREHCEAALTRIRALAGPAGTPSGYYAFMDSNLDRLDAVRPDLFAAIAASGLDYIVSSALPGRNRMLWREPGRGARGAIAINQSPRVVHAASPFVRATTAEDLNTSSAPNPGWIVATLDAPVIAFAPYIWRHGSRFMELVTALNSRDRLNVLPRVVARYARLLERNGYLPKPSSVSLDCP